VRTPLADLVAIRVNDAFEVELIPDAKSDGVRSNVDWGYLDKAIAVIRCPPTVLHQPLENITLEIVDACPWHIDI
jgi:hypothetical protein